MIEAAGLTAVDLGPLIDTFAGTEREDNARLYGTWGRSVRARRPLW